MQEIVIFVGKTLLVLLPFVLYAIFLKWKRIPNGEFPSITRVTGGTPYLVKLSFRGEDRIFMVGEGFCHEITVQKDKQSNIEHSDVA